MIDLDPSDPSCIYTTMDFVSSQARRYDAIPILTFDQPLYWKALTIIIQSQPYGSDLKGMVLRLGGFHMQMSFLGSIGHLMSGSGLQALLEVVFTGNAVRHMLTGKAISRAVRGHMLVDAALNTILVSKAYHIMLPTKETDEPKRDTASTDPENDDVETDQQKQGTVDVTSDITESKDIYDKAMLSTLSVEEVCSAGVLVRIKGKLDDLTQTMTTRTAMLSLLWLQYLDMVSILQMFIKAERMANWKLHLQTVQDMLPYFAASDHSLYAKSAYVYLEIMLRLSETHPDAHRKFMEGYHVVRRSDRFWAGLSPDLIIEQVLMRSIKTHDGLTRGKGMTENQRLVWVLSMPVCASINGTMQKFSSVSYETSDQHNDVSAARQARDVSDTVDLIDYLNERDPFGQNDSLFNIANGMTAQERVNVEKAREIGVKIVESMAGKSTDEFTFRKANQVVTLGSRSTVKIKDEHVNIDPQLLFQTLLTVR